MAQTKTEIQTLLAEAHAAPLHRFGQNFMIDRNLVRLVAKSAEISGDDLVRATTWFWKWGLAREH
jgi:hypothetical protein